MTRVRSQDDANESRYRQPPDSELRTRTHPAARTEASEIIPQQIEKLDSYARTPGSIGALTFGLDFTMQEFTL